MRFPLPTIRGWMVLAGLASWLGLSALGQDSSGQPLGDVARKTRREHMSTSHVPAKLMSEDDNGPDSGGVWRVRLCVLSPCFELSISLPKSPKWTRQTEEPRPVLILLPGHEEDSSRSIRVYGAEALPQNYTYDSGTRMFVQGRFARPEYFGQAAHILQQKRIMLDSRNATIARFTVSSGVLKYRGLSVVAITPYGDLGFACVFREEDSSAATSVCDAIVTSARIQVLQAATPRVYPTYQDPPVYDPQYNDPPDDPPENDDPD